MNPQDPTPEEIDEAHDDLLLQEDEEQRNKNAKLAEEKGWQFQPGVGWVDEKGTVRLDPDNREM